MKGIFLGSGPFALEALELLHARSGRHEILRVVTRPDRPQGRGRKLVPTPVRRRAGELGIPCGAPGSVNDPASIEELRALGADICIVADYGEILRKPFRELFRIGAFNLHASILPAFRGAAPIPHAILAGAKVTGVTLFRIEKRLDAGPIVDAESLEVLPLETAGELEARLASLAAHLLDRNLEPLAAGRFHESIQDESRASFAPKIAKSAGVIDWSLDPVKLTDVARALNPWPGAHSFLLRPGKAPERTVFLRVRPADRHPEALPPPGSVVAIRKEGFQVACGGGAVEAVEVQREGKAPLDAASYLRGKALRPGDRFGAATAATEGEG